MASQGGDQARGRVWRCAKARVREEAGTGVDSVEEGLGHRPVLVVREEDGGAANPRQHDRGAQAEELQLLPLAALLLRLQRLDKLYSFRGAAASPEGMQAAVRARCRAELRLARVQRVAACGREQAGAHEHDCAHRVPPEAGARGGVKRAERRRFRISVLCWDVAKGNSP